jgi:hypothetical protein
MDIGIYKADNISNEEIKEYVNQRKSFVLTDIKHMSATVRTVESIIEKSNLKVRVYTDYRKGLGALLAASTLEGTAAVSLGAVATGMTATALMGTTILAGAVSVVGIGIHNLVTFNPDYELGKNYFSNVLTVKYKK